MQLDSRAFFAPPGNSSLHFLLESCCKWLHSFNLISCGGNGGVPAPLASPFSSANPSGRRSLLPPAPRPVKFALCVGFAQPTPTKPASRVQTRAGVVGFPRRWRVRPAQTELTDQERGWVVTILRSSFVRPVEQACGKKYPSLRRLRGAPVEGEETYNSAEMKQFSVFGARDS